MEKAIINGTAFTFDGETFEGGTAEQRADLEFVKADFDNTNNDYTPNYPVAVLEQCVVIFGGEVLNKPELPDGSDTVY